MNSFDCSQKSFIDLKKEIHKDPKLVVPFIGAGLSVYGLQDERLPLWKGLIEVTLGQGVANGVLDECFIRDMEALWENGQSTKAIDLIIEKIGLPTFRRIIESCLDIEGKTIPPAISQLVTIAWSLMVTTNLDRFIERAWHLKHNIELEVVTQKERSRLARIVVGADTSGACILAKIHGTIERFETWVLDERHYSNLIDRDQAYINTLRSLFLKNIFFIGYGLRDRDFDILLDQIKTIYPEGVGTYFALIDSRYRGADHVNMLIRNHGLRPIWYKFQPERTWEADGGHGQVVECLSQLMQVDSEGCPISLSRFPDTDKIFVGRKNDLRQLYEIMSIKSSSGAQIIGFGGEGKTSLILHFLESNKTLFEKKGFEFIYGCCFYHLDESIFIDELYSKFDSDNVPTDNAKKVIKICDNLEKKRILLVLDGLEVFQNPDGTINSPNLEKIIKHAIEGRGSIICGSRLALPYPLPEIALQPLLDHEVRELFSEWGIDITRSRIMTFVKEHVGNHALSVRLFAGLIKSYPVNIMSILNGMSSELKRDQLSSLSTNIAEQILAYYNNLLEEIEVQAITVISLFVKPVAVTIAMDCISECLKSSCHEYGHIQAALKKLIELRILIQESGCNLTMHPSIREYYQKQINSDVSLRWHGLIADYFVELTHNTCPEEIEQLSDFSCICYHASKSGEWTLFHDTFYRTINRNHRNFLGNNLGSWEDFYLLSKMTIPSGYDKPIIHPEYYLSCIARALKHLGRTSEALRYYLKCLLLCIKNKHFETARFANNFMLIAMMAGHIKIAGLLAKINIAGLSWDTPLWHRCWQEEYALYSIGYLVGIQGDCESAIRFCEHGNKTWERHGLERESFFDYYKGYHSELLLSESASKIDEAESIAASALKTSQKNRWHESEALSLRALSLCERARLSEDGRTIHMTRGERHIDQAKKCLKNINIPRADIELTLEEIRLIVWGWKFLGYRDHDLDKYLLLIDNVKSTIRNCEFLIYRSEYEAAMGWYYAMSDNLQGANHFLDKALAEALLIGDFLSVRSAMRLIKPLADHLNVTLDVKPIPFFQKDPKNLLKMKISQEELNEIILEIQLKLI